MRTTDLITALADNREFVEKSSSRNTMHAILLATGAAYFGYYISIYNPLNNKYFFNKAYNVALDDEKTQNEYIGNINLFFSLGAMIGVLFGGFIADQIGRIKMLLLVDLLAVVAAAGYFFDHPIYITYGMRFMGGITSAVYTSVNASLANELLP